VLNFFKNLFKTNNATDLEEGVVKFFNHAKGFGFITFKDSEKEIFVHKTNLKTRINQGNKVTFNIEQSKKGPIAVNVKKKTQ
jgi:CspA family cold shock protein